MPECVYTHSCKFIKVTIHENQALEQLLRNKYCLGGFQECARLKAVHELGGLDRVPADLWPDDLVGATRVILGGSPR